MLPLKNWLNQIVERSLLPTDNAGLRLKKIALTLVPLIIGVAAFIWGLIYFLLGHFLSGAIPLAYSIVSAISLVYLFRTKKTRFIQYSQLALVLVLPFLLMWSLGGFFAGSMVMIWAIFAPVAALIFLEKQAALGWFVMYLALILISVLIDDYVAAHTAHLPELARSLFFLLNLGCGSVGLFLLLSYTFSEEKRANAADLRIAASAFETQESLMVTDVNGVILRINQAFAESTGYAAEEVVGRTPRILKSDRHGDDFYRDMWQTVVRTGNWQGEIWQRRKSGEVYPAWLTISAVKSDERGIVTNYVGSFVDISERKQYEYLILENEQRLIDILNVSPIAVRIARKQGREVVFYNQSYADLIKNIHAMGDDPKKYYVRTDDYEKVLEELAQGKSVINRQIELRIPDNATLWTLASYMPIQYKGEDAVLGWFYDITSLKDAEEKIRLLAFHDPLTRLPNRQLLLDRLQQALASGTRTSTHGALLFIDLDNFKALNDTLGHAMGDLLLQQVAQRLTECVREGDTVARLGGDEFVVMLEDLSEQIIEAAEQVEIVGEKILASLGQPYQLLTHTFRSSASIGSTVFSGHQQETEELLKQADIAMYQAKKSGRNTLRFFDPQMQETINHRVALEGELHKALEDRQFQLHYQIQVDAARRPLGAEALIRWSHPERGIVSPAQFIPLAEETGLILRIGRWVLDTACAQLKLWEGDAATQKLILAVNVSARQFHQTDFVEQVRSFVLKHAIDPKLLKLELTESLLLGEIEDSVVTMKGLNEIGVKLSLDDFGTGYSSLQYLKLLPLNQIKIDQSFVRDIATDQNDAAIVQTIIAMAGTMGFDVIAEGVETESQLEFLELRGCHAFQGYLFGRPAPIGQFEDLVRS